jgi:hypothetical protein
MLHNEPVDILAIAKERLSYWSNALHYANMMQHSEASQQHRDAMWVQRRLAADDMDAVTSLIFELARSSTDAPSA